MIRVVFVFKLSDLCKIIIRGKLISESINVIVGQREQKVLVEIVNPKDFPVDLIDPKSPVNYYVVDFVITPEFSELKPFISYIEIHPSLFYAPYVTMSLIFNSLEKFNQYVKDLDKLLRLSDSNFHIYSNAYDIIVPMNTETFSDIKIFPKHNKVTFSYIGVDDSFMVEKSSETDTYYIVDK